MFNRQSVQRSELHRLAGSVANLAQDLEQAEDFATETARDFCRIIRETVLLIQSGISKAPDEKLLHIHFLLKQFGAHLRYPERSRIEQTPWSAVQATETFLQLHVGAHCKFIVRPQWNYNYGLVGDFIESYHKQIKELADCLPLSTWRKRIGPSFSNQIYCISFPRVERMNVLSHVNWGHEVGHILARRWLNQYFGVLWKQNSPAIRKRMKERLLAVYTKKYKPPSAFVNAKVADSLKETMHLTREALKELISDAVGAHLFGPAALASLGEFSCHNLLDANPLQCRGYPPWRFRLRAISKAVFTSLKKADKAEWNEILVEYARWIGEVSSIGRPTDDLKIIRADFRCKEAYAVVRSEWQKVWRQVLSELPKHSRAPYRLQNRWSLVGELIKRLEEGIPANETGTWPDTTPASLPDIWNAAWACKVHYLSHKDKVSVDANIARLFQLTLKAFESSFVHSKYQPQLALQELA